MHELKSSLIAICFSLLIALQAAAQDAESRLERANEELVILPLEDGTVDVGDLYAAVSGKVHWLAGSVTAFARIFAIDSEDRLTREQTLALANQFPEIFALQPTNDSPTSLAIQVNVLSQQLSDKKSSFRSWLAQRRGTKLNELICVNETWVNQDVRSSGPPRIVVAMAGIHGIESSAKDAVLAIHRKTNLPGYVFRYSNDAPVVESAAGLLNCLMDLHRQQPESKITLVAHSMGGLVARCVLENELAIQPFDSLSLATVCARTGVDQLIQVCPPNHGSVLATYAPLLEGVEQLSRLAISNSGENRMLIRAIVDGFNEASEDIQPNSKILNDLNSCQRNPEVRYCILAGNQAPLKPVASSLLTEMFEAIPFASDGAVGTSGELRRRVSEVLNCQELRQGLGDGVVTLESTKLPGVTDWELLAINHLTWSNLDTVEGRVLLEAICSRLGISL